MTGQPELSHDKHLKRCINRSRHFERDRYAAARQRQHDDVLALQVPEMTCQLPAGVTSVAVGLLRVHVPSHCPSSFENSGAIAMPRWHPGCVRSGILECGEVAMLRNSRAMLTGVGL